MEIKGCSNNAKDDQQGGKKMNFKNRLVTQKRKVKQEPNYTWASTAKTAEILKVSAAKLYEYRKKNKRNQLIEGVHYKRDEYRLCDRGSPLIYNLQKTCKRIHYLDFEIFTLTVIFLLFLIIFLVFLTIFIPLKDFFSTPTTLNKYLLFFFQLNLIKLRLWLFF